VKGKMNLCMIYAHLKQLGIKLEQLSAINQSTILGFEICAEKENESKGL
jgi:hypothetical protein